MLSYIYRFKINKLSFCLKGIPVAQVLAFKEKLGEKNIWIEMNDSLPKKDVFIEIVGTGWTFVMEGYTFLDTLVQSDGIVWHCYYKIADAE